MSEALAPAAGWVCPFCALACDHLELQVGRDDEPLALRRGDCPRARVGLQGFASRSTPVPPTVDGHATTLDAALAAAAQRLAVSRQPLFAGLGTDVAGARALYPLASACGAICDGANGAALMHTLRALQDRGQFTTTLAEVRTRADVMVFVGSVPTDLAPLLGERCGLGGSEVATRHIAALHPRTADAAVLAAWSGAGTTVESIAPPGDLFNTLATLNAALARPGATAWPAALRALAERLRAARYAVLIGAPLHLPAHGRADRRGGEPVDRPAQSSTAAPRRCGSTAATAPPRPTRCWPGCRACRCVRAPVRVGWNTSRCSSTARRLLDGAAVDLLLWVSCFDAAARPPPCTLPLIVLGHPAQACSGSAARRRIHPGGDAGHRRRRPSVPHRRLGADAVARGAARRACRAWPRWRSAC